MLIDFDYGGRIITAVPFAQMYAVRLRLLARRIHPLAIDTAKRWFEDELIDGIVATSWVPGADWTGTGYQALYDALNNVDEAAKFFGQVACDCVLDRCANTGETWGYGHYRKNDIPIKGRTYFRCNVPAAIISASPSRLSFCAR